MWLLVDLSTPLLCPYSLGYRTPHLPWVGSEFEQDALTSMLLGSSQYKQLFLNLVKIKCSNFV
jgi:hypothetical protein